MSKSYHLAVAAKSFDKPSETFIRQHATQLAPGATALLCYAESATGIPDAPALTEFNRRYSRPLRALGRRRIARFLRQNGTACVLAEYGVVGVDVYRGARQAGARVFVHFHGYDASKLLRNPVTVRAYQRMFRQIDGVFVPSAFLGRKLAEIGCPPEMITVSPCGVEPSEFARTSGDPNRLLSVGRMVGKKAPLATLSAFARVAAQFPDAHLDYVGEGELLDACADFLRENGLSDRVTLHGAQPHEVVKSLMSRAGIYLQHSVTDETGDCEGLPVAILEAMCAGLAVVSTRHSGIPEAVIEKQSGLLVDEHDVDGMARETARLLTDDALRETLATNAMARVREHFSKDRSLQILRDKMALPPVRLAS